MLKNFKDKIKRNLKVLGLIFIIIFTITIATLSNHQKNLSKNEYVNFINNIYLKKTLNEIANNLEPRYKKYNHKIKSGETFDKILNSYFINKEEIKAIKESLSKKVNINKLNTNQKIRIVLDKTNNKIKEFIFQVSNTKKIYLSKNSEDLEFNEKILSIKLDKKIIYK
ncbi:peptidase M23, partial [Pelagibacterales bacterium SAG-MED27]|nr:peptidase M23 [Pelagibacterales bacterium SAG-MED27]